MFICIVAIDPNKGIGKDKQLPWHIKEDLQLFKKNTLNHYIVMGNVTYDNLPVKLKDRYPIIVCNDPNYTNDDGPVVHDLISFLKEHQYDETEYFICGGATIYKLAYPYCQKAYISFVKENHDCDTFFSNFDMNDWNIDYQQDYELFTYRELSRK